MIADVAWTLGLLLAVGLVGFLVSGVFKTRREPFRTANAELIGKPGVAMETFTAKGRVKVQGEVWTATSRTGIISAGESIRVVSASEDLLQLEVEKTSDKS